MDDETLVTSPTGGSKGRKLARFDLIPTMPLRKLAEHFGRGATKYDDRNWERGYSWSLSYAAAQRHLNAFWGGEDWDPEFTESHHLDAAMFHLMALRDFVEKHPQYDDRPQSKRTLTEELRKHFDEVPAEARPGDREATWVERTPEGTFGRIAADKQPTREFARSQQTEERNGVQNRQEEWEGQSLRLPDRGVSPIQASRWEVP